MLDCAHGFIRSRASCPVSVGVFYEAAPARNLSARIVGQSVLMPCSLGCEQTRPQNEALARHLLLPTTCLALLLLLVVPTGQRDG